MSSARGLAVVSMTVNNSVLCPAVKIIENKSQAERHTQSNLISPLHPGGNTKLKFCSVVHGSIC